MADLEVVRVPGARPLYKSRPRDRHWDQRFVLERIPTYDAFKDKHCLAYLIANKKKKTVLAPGRIRKTRSPSNSLMPRPVRGLSTKPVLVGNVLRQLRSNLVELWSIQKVPQELWQPLLEAMDSGTVRDKAEALAREVEETEGKKSILLSLAKAISSRETALSTLPTLNSQETPSTRLIREAKEALATIRLLTLHVVECAAAYKDYVSRLGGAEADRVPVFYNGVNYMGKLKGDLRYLAGSGLGNVFEFSEKNDPFLLVPSRPRRKNREEVPLPLTLMERIKAAERVLLAEIALNADYEQISHFHNLPNKPMAETVPKPGILPTITVETHSPEHSLQPLPESKSLEDPAEKAVSPISDHREKTDFSGLQSEDKAEGTWSARSEAAPGEERALQGSSSLLPALSTPRQGVSSEVHSPTNAPIGPSIDLPETREREGVKPQTPPVVARIETKMPISDLRVADFGLSAAQLRTELDAFLLSVPLHIRETFWDASSFDSILKQSYPAWIQVLSSEKRLGIMSFSIDTINTSVKRTFIHHISAVCAEDLAATLDRGLRYIWETIGCSEVRIALNYREIEGKMEADPEMKSLVSERKFRWKNLTNTADGRRTIIMGVNRPVEVPCDSLSSDIFKESLLIRYAAGLQIASIDPSIPPSTETTDSGLISLVGLAACLKTFTDLSLAANSSQSQLISLRQALPEDFPYPACRLASSESLPTALENVNSQKLSLSGLIDGSMTYTVCMSLGLRWSSFDTALLDLAGESYHYLRISDLEVNVSKGEEDEVYLVPTDDSQFNLLIVACESLPAEPWLKAVSVLQDFTSGNRSFSEKAGEIWLPGFDTEQTSKPVQSLVGLEVGTERGVRYAVETMAMTLQAPIHSLGNICYESGRDSVVVAKPFLMGNAYTVILNSKLDDLTPTPYLVSPVPFPRFTKHAL